MSHEQEHEQDRLGCIGAVLSSRPAVFQREFGAPHFGVSCLWSPLSQPFATDSSLALRQTVHQLAQFDCGARGWDMREISNYDCARRSEVVSDFDNRSL